MITVKYDKGTDRFLVKGKVNLGIVGELENKEYGEENIEIKNTFEQLMKIVDAKDIDLLGNLFILLKDNIKDGESVAAILEDYYNKKIADLNKNIKQFNDCIWSKLFEYLMDIGWPFWENEETIAPEYRGQDLEEEVMHLYNDKQDEIYAILKEYTNGSPNNGTIQKIDVEKKMREYFYMFNFEGLVKNIDSQYLGFNFNRIEFQFEDNWNQELFCSTVGTLNEDFSLINWDNF